MGRRPVIQPYRGPLTASQVAAGMSAAARNARRLYEDAKLLLDAKRHASACSMAILSIEEAGKLSILREIACATNKPKLNVAWRRYGEHREKNAHWLLVELAGRGAKTLRDLQPIFDRSSDHPDVLNVIKQLGFYTDCYGPANWSEPAAVVDEQLADLIVRIAGVIAPKRDTSEREIELWVQHVGSCWGRPTMQAGLVAFQAAMQNEGLSQFTAEDMKRFCA